MSKARHSPGFFASVVRPKWAFAVTYRTAYVMQTAVDDQDLKFSFSDNPRAD